MIDGGVGAVLVVAAGLVGAILSGVGTLAYVRDVLGGRTVPHRGSWLVWSLIAVVAALAHGADGGRWSLLVLAGQAIGNLVVLALAVRRGIGGLSWGNALLVGVATLGILGWIRLGDTTSAVLCAALADGAGLVAIAPKIWADPFSETPATYGLAGATGLLAVLAVLAAPAATVEVSLLLFPCYFCVANTATAQLIALRRRNRLRRVGREVPDDGSGRVPRPTAWAARSRYLYAAVLLVLMCSYPSPSGGGWGTFHVTSSPCRQPRAGSNSSTTLPEGSSSRICWPPGPETMSLRNVSPSARSWWTSVAMSPTIRWMRFQPPGPGTVPSGIGRPAELRGPLSSSRRLPRTTSAKAGAALALRVNPRCSV
jgi:hypothetical protein